MALSLDPILATAQDSLERSPIIELVSTQADPAIPFDGEYFNESNTVEISPSMISHSSGRMVSAYVRDIDSVVILFTDVGKTVWVESVMGMGGFYDIGNLTICELSNGNIGIIYEDHDTSGGYKLKYIIVSISDTQATLVSGPVQIVAYGSPNIVSAPFVIRLQDDSFLLVYSHYNGTNYSIYKQISNDFISWNAATNITLSGFELTYDSDHPSLIQVASGDILLFLDHVTDEANDAIITNIFKLMSSDNGATWDVPEQLTSYTTWGSGGIHPYPALTAGNQIKLAFHETNNVLFMNYNSDLWQNDCASPKYSAGSSIHYDPVTKLLYVKQIFSTSGIKRLCGIVVIDVDTWTVVRNYNTGTVPDYSDLFLEKHVWAGAQKHHSEGKYVAISTMDQIEMATMVINDETETIKTYVFKTGGSYEGISKNMSNWPGVADVPEFWVNGSKIVGTWVDADTERVYLLMTYQYLYYPYVLVGYIDLTEVKDPVTGMYTFVKIGWDITNWTDKELTGLSNESGGILVEPGTNRFFLYGMTPLDSWRMKLVVYDLSTGATITEYEQSSSAKSFPYQGIGYCIYKDNHLYGMVTYHTGDDQDIYRGLCDLDLGDGSIKYHRPSYATIDQYDIVAGVVLDGDRIAFAASDYGVAIYNTVDDSWYLYNNDTVPGFEPTIYDPYPVSIDYNSVDDVIYVGSVSSWGGAQWAGVRALPECGSFNQGQYMIGTLGVGWSFGVQSDLSIGLADYDFTVAIDNEGILWAQWVRRDTSYLSIKWDKDQADFDLTSYLVGSVSMSWDIENTNTLSLTLSSGHLFDPHNSLSAINIFTKKGRPIAVRIGEKVGATEYWQNQGSFYIQSTRVSYTRGRYPTISIGCEDKTALLENIKIDVSDYYSDTYPEELLRDLITTYTNLESVDISIDDFDTRHALWHQIIDDNLMSAVTEILDHFGYFVYMDVDNNFTTKKAKVLLDALDHTYAEDTATIINFTPNDNYSTLINRVVVRGELNDPLEVLYAEELVGSLAGTGGWWDTDTIVETVWFSEDHKKKCRNVRLVTVKSIEDFEILWVESKGTEFISFYDPDELYIEITIEFPGLQGILIALLAAIIVLGILAVDCDSSLSSLGKGDCGYYIMAFTLLTNAVGYILGQVATYEYEIYGSPVGEVKQTVQAIANDEELQTYLGLILTEELDDEFCYSPESCQTVADYELEIVKAQRRKVSFSKITHLQDEIGDSIKHYHPYSNQALDVFITSLRRTLNINRGELLDYVEGWTL